MKPTVNRLILAGQLALTAFLAVGFAASFLLAEEPYGFNGIWQRNEDESDDPRDGPSRARDHDLLSGGDPPQQTREVCLGLVYVDLDHEKKID